MTNSQDMNTLTPAQQLQGARIESGWTVLERVVRNPETTSGGLNSTGYIIEHDDGRRGFLKAIDYAEAMGAHGTPDRMKRILDKYVFERDLCVRCRDYGLTRIVHAISHGSHFIDASPFSKVEYLIFDLADGGDIRVFLDSHGEPDLPFKLRTLHNVAAALASLHRFGIAHQDLKPSNVLLFQDGKHSRLADLGRAWAHDIDSPHDTDDVAGDGGYAPFELLYSGVISQDQKRYGCDMYLLGSLFVFLFVGIHINPLISGFLSPDHQVRRAMWNYAEFLPYVEAAFAEAVHQFGTCVLPDFRQELSTMVFQLCHPDPSRRGHPSNKQSNQFSLERYVSRLDYLTKKAEVQSRVERA